MGKPLKYPDALFPEAAPCKGMPDQTPEARQRFVDSFKTRFPAALEEVAQAHPAVHEALAANAKNCQRQCLISTLSLAVQNLWDAGSFAMENAEALSMDALTGAVQACFPEVAHKGHLSKGVDIFVHQMFEALNDDLDVVRLHSSSHMTRLDVTSSGSHALFAMFGVSMITLPASFMALILWQRRTQVEPQQEQEQEVANLLPEGMPE